MSHNIISVDNTSPDVNSDFRTQFYIQFGRGEIPSSPSITLNTGEAYPLYDTAPVNTIEGATINTTNDEFVSVELPAGQYLIYLNAGAVASPTSNFYWGAYYFTDSPTQINPIAGFVGANAVEYMNPYASVYCPSYLNLSSATTCYVKCGNSAGPFRPHTSTNSRYALTSSLTIIKVD